MSRRQVATLCSLLALVGLAVGSADSSRSAGARGHSGTGGDNHHTASVDPVAARLETAIPQLMKDDKIPAVSVALIRHGRVIWHQAYGYKSGNQRADDESVFEAASLSKPVFAYAVLKLVDQGRIDLDTPISRFLPQRFVIDDERANRITVRMLLTHTSGLPNRNSDALKLYFDPGSRFSYSGKGFLYLQRAVEQITGMSLEQFMQSTVLRPLGMLHSSYDWLPSYSLQKACGHYASGEEELHPYQFAEPLAYGTLQTTASDYAKFVVALTNGSGLSAHTFRQMMSPQVRVDQDCVECLHQSPGRISSYISWGLGIGLEKVGHRQRFWHLGANRDRFQSFVMGSIRRKEALVILTNSGNGLSIVPNAVGEVFGGAHPAFEWGGIRSAPGRQ